MIIDTEQLEIFLLLMKQYNVEHLEMEGIKISMKFQGPEIPKSKPTIEKLDKLANVPTTEELEMWSAAVAPKSALGEVLPRRKG